VRIHSTSSDCIISCGRASRDEALNRYIGTIAISGIELALWDAAGKILDQPVYQLLGGKTREKVRMYADCHAGEGMVESALNHQPDETYKAEAYARAARAAVDDGYEIIKFDLDVPSGRDIDTLARHFDPQRSSISGAGRGRDRRSR